MATLYIAEFSLMGQAPNAVPAMAMQPPLAEQAVGVGGSSTASSAFNVLTRFVRVHTDSICSIEFGQNPTATTTSARMAANQTEYFAVPEGGAFKVAVIGNS